MKLVSEDFIQRMFPEDIARDDLQKRCCIIEHESAVKLNLPFNQEINNIGG